MGVSLFRDLRGIIRHRGDTLDCIQAVELVTEYVEGAMPDPEAKRFERHLRACPDCVRYVEQVRHTTDVLGHVHPPPPSGPAREGLLKTFRDFQRD